MQDVSDCFFVLDAASSSLILTSLLILCVGAGRRPCGKVGNALFAFSTFPSGLFFLFCLFFLCGNLGFSTGFPPLLSLTGYGVGKQSLKGVAWQKNFSRNSSAVDGRGRSPGSLLAKRRP